MCCIWCHWKMDLVVKSSWNLQCAAFECLWKLDMVLVLSWNLQWTAFDCSWNRILSWNLLCAAFCCHWKLYLFVIFSKVFCVLLLAVLESWTWLWYWAEFFLCCFDGPWKLDLVVVLSWNLQCGALTVPGIGCLIELKFLCAAFDCPCKLSLDVVLSWNFPGAIISWIPNCGKNQSFLRCRVTNINKIWQFDMDWSKVMAFFEFMIILSMVPL